MVETVSSHAKLMDRTYRHQRLIYDITRRHFLLGRDRLIGELTPPRGGRILEIACGTGRNLARVRKLHPDCALFGVDISQEMLRTARSRLGDHAQLVLADACDLDGEHLFGKDGFDRVVLSYSLSMIPDWDRALRQAVAQLAPGGRLHVVDFGDQRGLPRWFRYLLRAGLARFHVAPRTDLMNRMQALANEQGLTLRFQGLYLDYAQYGVLSRAPLNATA
ncbi:MAG: class I SAM-dependent methyltransferase [Gemmobacter sp.]